MPDPCCHNAPHGNEIPCSRPIEFDPIECIAEAITARYGGRGALNMVTPLDRDIAHVAWDALLASEMVCILHRGSECLPEGDAP